MIDPGDDGCQEEGVLQAIAMFELGEAGTESRREEIGAATAEGGDGAVAGALDDFGRRGGRVERVVGAKAGVEEHPRLAVIAEAGVEGLRLLEPKPELAGVGGRKPGEDHSARRRRRESIMIVNGDGRQRRPEPVGLRAWLPGRIAWH